MSFLVFMKRRHSAQIFFSTTSAQGYGQVQNVFQDPVKTAMKTEVQVHLKNCVIGITLAPRVTQTFLK